MTDDTLCFSLPVLQEIARKLEQRKVLVQQNDILKKDLDLCDSQHAVKDSMILDFQRAQILYIKNDSLRVQQMDAKDQQIKLEKKRNTRSKWILGGTIAAAVIVEVITIALLIPK